jgi:hypothetical protein
MIQGSERMSKRLFYPNHLIWQYADYHEEINELLPEIEELVSDWAAIQYNDGNVSDFFKTEYEIRLASFLAYDNLLPIEARKAFSMLPLLCLQENESKSYISKALMMKGKRKGRKRGFKDGQRIRDVEKTISDNPNLTKTKVYEIVADKHCVSSVTIRRTFERYKKNGENKKLNSPVQMF